MDELNNRLKKLNDLSERIYQHVETGSVNLTRRRMLVVQTLQSVDRSSNTVFQLLSSKPAYIDGAQVIMRSIYDLLINTDWILADRTNGRLWRWLRDDRKLIRWHLTKLVELKTQNPKLNTKADPLKQWTDGLKKIEGDFAVVTKWSGTPIKDKEVGFFEKVKTFSLKGRVLYHMMFWLFSTKTHGTPTGMQELMTTNPIKLKRRTDEPSQEQLIKAGRSTIAWYASHLKRTAKYLQVPFVKEVSAAYEESLKKVN